MLSWDLRQIFFNLVSHVQGGGLGVAPPPPKLAKTTVPEMSEDVLFSCTLHLLPSTVKMEE